MGSRNISISDEAYHKLRDIKMKNESFTDVINRLTNKTSILELKGLLSSSEADSIHSSIKESRKLSRKRLGSVVSEFNKK
ncbi:MAG: antitoxin VapB family protein [Thermoplasmataceae archaeon]